MKCLSLITQSFLCSSFLFLSFLLLFVLLPLSSLLVIIGVCMSVRLYAHACHVTMYVCRSEDNIWESVLFYLAGAESLVSVRLPAPVWLTRKLLASSRVHTSHPVVGMCPASSDLFHVGSREELMLAQGALSRGKPFRCYPITQHFSQLL